MHRHLARAQPGPAGEPARPRLAAPARRDGARRKAAAARRGKAARAGGARCGRLSRLRLRAAASCCCRRCSRSGTRSRLWRRLAPALGFARASTARARIAPSSIDWPRSRMRRRFGESREAFARRVGALAAVVRCRSRARTSRARFAAPSRAVRRRACGRWPRSHASVRARAVRRRASGCSTRFRGSFGASARD